MSVDLAKRQPQKRGCCLDSAPAATGNGLALSQTDGLQCTSDNQRFIIEVQRSPARLLLRDVNTDEILLAFDEKTSDQFLSLTQDTDRSSPALLADSLQLMAASLAERPPTPAESTRDVVPQKDAPSGQFVASATTKRTRKKLWDMPANLHCPIIGTCLDAQELRKLARKAGCEQQHPLTDYEVHVSFVGSADERNPLSISVQKALEKKYSAHIKRYAKARTTEALTGLWDQALANGDVPGAFWATLTHPKCDDALRRRAREEVHMLSHQVGAGQRADLRRLAIVESELKKLKYDFDMLFKDSRKQLDERDRRVLGLETELEANRRELSRLTKRELELQHRISDLQSIGSEKRFSKLQRQVEVLHRQRAQAIKDRQHWRQACEAASYRAETLQNDLMTKCEECEILENLFAQSVSSCQGCEEQDCSNCPDLQGRKILCVGGRNQLINQYRALVDRYNGQFVHHDGGIEHSRQRLESMLSAADAVVCTTDCVSHDAYYRLKKFCKRNETPYALIPTSGVSTFARALNSVAN